MRVLLVVVTIVLILTLFCCVDWNEISMSIKKKKSQKKNELSPEEIKLQREEYQRKVQIIDSIVEDLKRNEQKECRERYNKYKIDLEEKNKKCPKCGDSDCHTEYKRVSGKLSGHKDSISGNWRYFSGGSGSIHGEVDTLEVNKCNKCQTEWIPEKICSYFESGMSIESTEKLIEDLVKYLYRYEKIVYNETDITEKYNSLEEKQEAYYKQNLEILKSSISKYSIEVIYYYACTGCLCSSRIPDFYLEELIDMKNKECCYISLPINKYICEFKPSVIEILKKLGCTNLF